MDNLDDIKHRHDKDPWRDAVFIVLAVVLTALSIGSVTSRAAGRGPDHHWSVVMTDEHGEIVR